MSWTITGNSPIAKTYTSREQFLRQAIDPLNRRLSKKIIPVQWAVYAEGDMVIALWSGEATAKDGRPYNNTYAWFMTLRADRDRHRHRLFRQYRTGGTLEESAGPRRLT